ncbi:MAG TPA: Rv3235 family protein [Mycobacteriales bacterium]|nr:Rv3235 family protein [Mycobacteriales bacterium]
MTDQADAGAAKVLMLRHAPRVDGPYDDETHERSAIVIDGSLALAFPPSMTLTMPLRLVPPAGGVDTPNDDPSATTAAAPDPRRLIGPLAQAIAEVLTGFRPPQQLAQVATLDVLALLERNAGRMVPRGVRTPQRPRVSSLRLCEPRAGVAEVSAVIDTGVRRRAMALRLEAPNARWRCTVLRVG